MITTVRKVMTTKMITIPSGSSLFQARQLMEEKRIRHLPVVDKEQNIIGLFSQRDLSLIAEVPTIPVDWVMVAPVEFVDERTSLRSSVLRILQLKISSLLVTSKDEEVVGIVTTDDLLWHLSHLLVGETEEPNPMTLRMGLETIGAMASRLSDMGI